MANIFRKLVEFDTKLSPKQVEHLERHVYRSTGVTLCMPTLQILWEFLFQKLVPLSISGNVITMFGLLLNIMHGSIMMYFCPTAKETAPVWAYFLAAFLIFVYQIMDELDGKQDRRLHNKDTLLGEFVDHGCDSVTANFLIITTCISAQLGVGLGDHPNLFFAVCLATWMSFYMAQWQNYASGFMLFRTIDHIEVQLSFCAVCLISGCFGPEIWRFQVPLLGMELKVVAVVIGIMMTSVSCYENAKVVWKAAQAEGKDNIWGTRMLSPLYHILVVFVFAIVAKCAFSDLFEHSPYTFLLLFGLLGAKATQKQMIANMTKIRMSMLDVSFIGPLFLIVNRWGIHMASDVTILYIALVWVALDLVRYFTLSVIELDNVQVALDSRSTKGG